MALELPFGMIARMASTDIDGAVMGNAPTRVMALDLPHETSIWPLDSVSMVPFDQVELSHGNASELPSLLKSLDVNVNERLKVDEILSEISSIIHPRGLLCAASALTVPFLCQIALKCANEEAQLEILRFIVSLYMVSSVTYFPLVRTRVALASSTLIDSMNFNPDEPSVKNVSACFFALIVPPERETDRQAVALLLEPALRSTHGKFKELVKTTRRVLLRQLSINDVDLEQLENDLFDDAEDWDCQRPERERLLTLCKYSDARRLPSDIMRNVKAFLFVAHEV